MKHLSIAVCLLWSLYSAADTASCTSTYVDLSTQPPTQTVGPGLVIERNENGQGFARIEDTDMDLKYSFFYDWNNQDAYVGISTLNLSEAFSAQGKLERPDPFVVNFVKKNWGRQFGVTIVCGLD